MFNNRQGDGPNLSIYSGGYDYYRSWALNSLDAVKNELLSLCFPLFVCSYISLVRKSQDDEEEARLFWDRWSADHQESYGQELQELSMLTSAAQLDTHNKIRDHRFIACSLTQKFDVIISELAFGLLTTFLSQNDLLLIASIINDKVHFKLVEKLPAHLQQGHGGILVELPGYTAVPEGGLNGTGTANLPVLALGVPGKGNKKSPIPDYLRDDVYRHWIEKLVLRDILLAQSQHGNSTIFSDTFEKPGEPVGDALDPSIIFATLTNSHEGMICMDINNSIDQAVAGFRDSSVRVWNLKDDNIEKNSPFDFDQSGVINPGSAQNEQNRKQSASSRVGLSLNVPIDDDNRSHSLMQLRGHTGTVYGVSQDKTGRLVVSSSSDETIRLWDTSVRQCVGKYTSLSTAWDVSFGPLGYYFAAACMDNTMSVYSTDRPTQVRLMTGHTSDVTCCSWHNNASLVVSGSDDKTVRLWDLRVGQSVRLLRGSPAAISTVTVSPVGDKIAAGSDSGAIHLWDIGSGRQIGLLQGHTGPVHSAAFSANGEALSTGGADCSVKVWDASKIKLGDFGSYQEHGGSVGAAGLGIPIFQAKHTFHTKFTPVFYVNYSLSNLLYAGGPYTSESSGALSGKAGAVGKTEEEVVHALGLAFAQRQ